VEIRPVAVADVGDVARFHLRTVLAAYAGIFPDAAPPPTEGQLADDWTRRVGRSWLALDVGGICGTVSVDGADLQRLMVEPGRWGHGLGRQLHDLAVEQIAAAGHAAAELWVLEENHRARAFYERLGWQLRDEAILTHPVGVREVRYRLELQGRLG
jgi:GNAT superfamily N-acetyltransferase